MKRATLLFILLGAVTFSAAPGCTASAEEKKSEEQEPKPPPFEDYVGTYKINETKHDRYCDVFIENDTLYLHSLDIGNSKMYAEENEVFDVPGHKTRMRFLRDEAGLVDRVVILTEKGRYTAVKVAETGQAE